jgi:hypothetical protein
MVFVKFVVEKQLYRVICNFRLQQKLYNYFLYHRDQWFNFFLLVIQAFAMLCIQFH